MRHLVLLSVVLIALPALAAKKPDAPKQFIDKSVVTFPKVAGNYTLLEQHYDPLEWNYGVGTRWVATGMPEAKIDVFVYPLGRSAENVAVAGQMDQVELQLRDAQKQGVYARLETGAREAFAVISPDHVDEGLAPKPEVRLEARKDADPLAATLAEATPSPNTHGQRQAYRFDHDGVAMRSLAYVFYRQLFAIKVRITMPADRLDEAAFAALADTAVRTLVPRFDAANFGTCGNVDVAVPADAPAVTRGKKNDESDAVARQLIFGVARVQREGCSATDNGKLVAKPGTERIEIVYPPDTWSPGA